MCTTHAQRLLRKCKRARKTCKSRRFKKSRLSTPVVIDHVRRDLSLPVQGMIKPSKEGVVGMLRRQPKEQFGDCFFQYGFYIRNYLSYKETDNYRAALNKVSRLFGSISRERTFRFILKVLIVTGMNPDDFKSLMRIRDIWVRGRMAQYYKSASHFAGLLPSDGKRISIEVSKFSPAAKRRRAKKTCRKDKDSSMYARFRRMQICDGVYPHHIISKDEYLCKEPELDASPGNDSCSSSDDNDWNIAEMHFSKGHR